MDSADGADACKGTCAAGGGIEGVRALICIYKTVVSTHSWNAKGDINISIIIIIRFTYVV